MKMTVLIIWPSNKGSSGGAPWWSYWSASITNTIGPAMGIEALKYISYPAQVSAHTLVFAILSIVVEYFLDCVNVELFCYALYFNVALEMMKKKKSAFLSE